MCMKTLFSQLCHALSMFPAFRASIAPVMFFAAGFDEAKHSNCMQSQAEQPNVGLADADRAMLDSIGTQLSDLAEQHLLDLIDEGAYAFQMNRAGERERRPPRAAQGEGH